MGHVERRSPFLKEIGLSDLVKKRESQTKK